MKNRITLLSLACATVLSASSIKSIEYLNVSKVSPQVLEETLGMRTGDSLDSNKLNEALIKFYSYDYFDDIIIDNEKKKKKIIFKEKPSIANVDIKGYKTRSEDTDAIKKVLKLNKGSMYSEKRVKEAKDQLLGMLSSEGFINSVVEVETEKLNDSSIKLTFNVNKGDEIIIREAKYHSASELDGSDFKKVTANKEKEFAYWWFGQSDGEMKIDQLKYDARRIND